MIQQQTGTTFTSASGRRFIRHYVEMVLAMAVGMPVYGMLFVSPLDPLGYRAVLEPQPYVRELLMLVAMSLPMVAFMAYRRHSPRLTAEMVAGMAVPTVAVVGLAAASWVPFLTPGTLSLFSHAAMLLGMLVAMLYRRAEYSHAHDHAHAGHSASAH